MPNTPQGGPPRLEAPSIPTPNPGGGTGGSSPAAPSSLDRAKAWKKVIDLIVGSVIVLALPGLGAGGLWWWMSQNGEATQPPADDVADATPPANDDSDVVTNPSEPFVGVTCDVSEAGVRWNVELPKALSITHLGNHWDVHNVSCVEQEDGDPYLVWDHDGDDTTELKPVAESCLAVTHVAKGNPNVVHMKATEDCPRITCYVINRDSYNCEYVEETVAEDEDEDVADETGVDPELLKRIGIDVKSNGKAIKKLEEVVEGHHPTAAPSPTPNTDPDAS